MARVLLARLCVRNAQMKTHALYAKAIRLKMEVEAAAVKSTLLKMYKQENAK